MSKFHLECTKSELDGKTDKPPETGCKKHPKKNTSDLLSSLNPNRPCSCEVTARALSDDVPKFLGLKERRSALERDQKSDTELDPNDSKALKDPRNQPENSGNTKPADKENKQPDLAPSK